jgi:hypothetical protein
MPRHPRRSNVAHVALRVEPLGIFATSLNPADATCLRSISNRSGSRTGDSNHEISRGLQKFESSRCVQPVASPASEQSAHHAADQATWTSATTAVMVSTTSAATMGQIVVIGFVAGAGVGH